MQRSGGGNANLEQAGRDRRLDILAAPGAGIALPFKSFKPEATFPLEFECLSVKMGRRKSN